MKIPYIEYNEHEKILELWKQTARLESLKSGIFITFVQGILKNEDHVTTLIYDNSP